mmetsp:Transcript_39599/g.88599  ORF Transcript_39599/g.88599 Transcript_39599/m.88599 type:complete len:837 (+) Transcript_39599:2043-4553(+)
MISRSEMRMVIHLKMRSRWPMNRSSPSLTHVSSRSSPAFPQSIWPCFFGKKASTLSLEMVFSHRPRSTSVSFTEGGSFAGGTGHCAFHASASRLSLPLFSKSASPAAAPPPDSAALEPPPAAAAWGSPPAEGAAAKVLVSISVLSKIFSSFSLVVRCAEPESLSMALRMSDCFAPFLATTRVMIVSAAARTLESLSFMQSKSWGRTSFMLVPTLSSGKRLTAHSRRQRRETGLQRPDSLAASEARTTSRHFWSALSPYTAPLSMAKTHASRIVILVSAQPNVRGLITALRMAAASWTGMPASRVPRAWAASGLLFICKSARHLASAFARSLTSGVMARSAPSHSEITLSMASFRTFHFLLSPSPSSTRMLLPTSFSSSSRSPPPPPASSSSTRAFLVGPAAAGSKGVFLNMSSATPCISLGMLLRCFLTKGGPFWAKHTASRLVMAVLVFTSLSSTRAFSNSAMQNSPTTLSPQAPTPNSLTVSTTHGTPSWCAMGDLTWASALNRSLSTIEGPTLSHSAVSMSRIETACFLSASFSAAWPTTTLAAALSKADSADDCAAHALMPFQAPFITLAFLSLNLLVLALSSTTRAPECEWTLPAMAELPPNASQASIFSFHPDPARSLSLLAKPSMPSPWSRASASSSLMSRRPTLESSLSPPALALESALVSPLASPLAPSFFEPFLSPLLAFLSSPLPFASLAPAALAAASGSAASQIFLYTIRCPLSLDSLSGFSVFCTLPAASGFSFFSRISSCVRSSTAAALTLGSLILVTTSNPSCARSPTSALLIGSLSLVTQSAHHCITPICACGGTTLLLSGKTVFCTLLDTSETLRASAA